MHSSGGKTSGVMVVVCSPPSQEEPKHTELLADLHRVVAKLKSGGRERDGDRMAREERHSPGVVVNASPWRHAGAGHNMLWGSQNRMMLSHSGMGGLW